ncbi:MAG: hypothetical protein HYS12_07360 [Planctomycetes bacterium]|nr:hypothetical protein [Planctomycetota bacterium]
MTDHDHDLMQQLQAPFAPGAIKFKPGVITGNRALALPFVDSRAVQDRLDEVLGVAGWQDSYQPLPDGSVVCTLRVRIGGEWIAKVDVGSPAEQPDAGDRCKAAFSDALKRAAVKYGVGRYLYRLPPLWADYDPAKKRFVQPPTLPMPPRPAQTPAVQAANRRCPTGRRRPPRCRPLCRSLRAPAGRASRRLCPSPPGEERHRPARRPDDPPRPLHPGRLQRHRP